MIITSVAEFQESSVGQLRGQKPNVRPYINLYMHICLALLHSSSPLFICEVFVSVRKLNQTGFTRVWKCNYNSQRLLTQQSCCRSALNISVGRKSTFNSLTTRWCDINIRSFCYTNGLPLIFNSLNNEFPHIGSFYIPNFTL